MRDALEEGLRRAMHLKRAYDARCTYIFWKNVYLHSDFKNLQSSRVFFYMFYHDPFWDASIRIIVEFFSFLNR